jgi:hypothetical protein
VKPETAEYLAKARKDLGEARQIIQIGLTNAETASLRWKQPQTITL